MKRSRILILAAATAVSVAACDGIKEAFTAHTDVVARAGGQQLTAERLAKLMANAGQIPIQKDIANVVANLWVSYQLLGTAGAKGDTLGDQKVVDGAMWAMLDNAKAQKWYEMKKKAFPKADTTNLDAQYAQGNLMAAQHILIMMPENGAGMSPAKQDSIKNRAESIRKQVTSANFNEMAKKYTEEPGGKERNGTLGVFPSGPGGMVPEFENGVRALKPGEISPALVKTSYGYHIIRRNLLSEVRPQFIEQLVGRNEQDQSKKMIKALEQDYKLDTMPKSAAKARDVWKDPDGLANDKTVLAKSRLRDFTAARLSRWIQAFPPQSAAQLKQQILQAPDTIVVSFVKSLAGQELIVAEADKAKITPDSNDVKQINGMFRQMVSQTMQGLRLDPKSLGDSAKSGGEKEKLAAARVEEALDQLFATNGQNFVDMPQQLAQALRDKYPWRVNPAGIDRAVERAQTLRASLDSAKAKNAPPVAPGTMGNGKGALPPGAIPVPVPDGAKPQPGKAPPPPIKK